MNYNFSDFFLLPNNFNFFQGTTIVTAAVVEVHSRDSQVKTTLNMSFRTDYLTMILYSPNPEQVS